MRQIVIDTETTGLDPAQGHRVIEIACVEIVNRRITGRTYREFLCPDRAVDEGAYEIHGISTEFLADKPRFTAIADEFLEFIRGAELVIHNAAFDVGFINYEFGLLERSIGVVTDHCSVFDTLTMARQIHPGQKNSLDALCRRYNIDNSQRQYHGALLDAQLLAEIYLVMSGGQTALFIGEASSSGVHGNGGTRRYAATAPTKVIHADADELHAHARQLALIDKASNGACVWRKME